MLIKQIRGVNRLFSNLMIGLGAHDNIKEQFPNQRKSKLQPHGDGPL
jgi:hypothetical protein